MVLMMIYAYTDCSFSDHCAAADSLLGDLLCNRVGFMFQNEEPTTAGKPILSRMGF